MMTEDTIVPLATPTRFLMENGEWNLTPNLNHAVEINPFEYNLNNNMNHKEFVQQKQQQQQQQQSFSDPESDITPSPTTPPMSLSQSPVSSNKLFHLNEPKAIEPNQIVNQEYHYQHQHQYHQQHHSPTSLFKQDNIYPPTSPPPKRSSVSSGRKRRIIFEGEDAEERRKKFLERNRVAAYKCRQKKKNWVQELEQKAEIQNTQNEELRNMVTKLKEESMYLRNLLLTHGNCDCESVQAYLRKTSLEISNNTLKRDSIFYDQPSTGLTPFLNNIINKPTNQNDQPTDYFSQYHHK